MNKFEVNSFQVPNVLVDELLEHLSGNELKCYLFIVRKTKGWQKEEDAISISQFIKATKLSNRVIIQSCKKLVDLGLIEQKTGYRNTNVYLCKKVTCDEKSHVTKTTTTYDEKLQELMTKSHTHKYNINTLYTKDNKEIYKESKKFISPTLEEIQNEINLKNYNNITAIKFFEFYEMKNWMVGKTKMSNWKMALSRADREWQTNHTKQEKRRDSIMRAIDRLQDGRLICERD